MQKFMWNNPAHGVANTTSIRNNPFPTQSWMPPAFYNPQNWNRNIPGTGETGNSENCCCGNLPNLPPYGYPVLQRGDGSAYYLLMSAGHAPYGYMPPNMDFYRNAMPPISGNPMNAECKGAGDEGSESELVIP